VSKINVGIVEDQPLFLDLLRSALASHPDIEVLFACTNVRDARAALEGLAEEGQPPLHSLVLDLELPDGNGIGLGVQARRGSPELGVVILSGKSMLDIVQRLPEHQHWPWSYLYKTSAANLQLLVNAIWASVRGIPVVDPSLGEQTHLPRESSILRLSERRREVLRLVSEGKTNEVIAQELGLSVNSVVNYLSAVYDALDISDSSNPRVAATLRYLEEMGDSRVARLRDDPTT
jgi:DNA-binding NarL/FixJ family response regulator